MKSPDKIFYQEQLSTNEQIAKFNESILVLGGLLDGGVKMMRIEVSGNHDGSGYKIMCTPMKWERIWKEEENEKKNKKKKGKKVEVSEQVELEPITRELRRDVPSALADCNFILNISSNRKLSETSPSGLLTDVVLQKKSANGLSENGSKKTLDLWVSARDGVQEKGSFQTYRAGFNEQGELAEKLADVNKLIGEVVEDLRKESNVD